MRNDFYRLMMLTSNNKTLHRPIHYVAFAVTSTKILYILLDK